MKLEAGLGKELINSECSTLGIRLLMEDCPHKNILFQDNSSPGQVII